MAQRGAWTPDKVRQRIQTTMLIKRLEDHALGKIEMTATQITAAQTLLRKSLADLSQIEHTGEVTTHYVAELPKPAESADEWQRTRIQ